MMTINLSPGSALRGIDDARDLVDRLERRERGPGFNASFLQRFVYLFVRDRDSWHWLASEKDSLMTRMARLSWCDPASLRFDVERVAEERDNLCECEHLE